MNVEQILKLHNLKNTGCRKFIISKLIDNDTALSESEIKQSLPDLFDRVTFYRSLKTLEEKNIIHKVVLSNTTVKYALNKNSSFMGKHAHFYCTHCGGVTCIDSNIMFPPYLPEGFTFDTMDVLLEGTCAGCNQSL